MVYSETILKRKFPKSGDYVFTKANKLKDFRHYKIIFKKGAIAIAKILP